MGLVYRHCNSCSHICRKEWGKNKWESDTKPTLEEKLFQETAENVTRIHPQGKNMATWTY